MLDAGQIAQMKPFRAVRQLPMDAVCQLVQRKKGMLAAGDQVAAVFHQALVPEGKLRGISSPLVEIAQQSVALGDDLVVAGQRPQ